MVRFYLVFARTISGEYENILFTLSRSYAARAALRECDAEKSKRRRRYSAVFVHEIDVSEFGHVSRPLDWLDIE